MSRHTPGPWREASWKADRIIEALADPENSTTYYAPICELDDGWSEKIGNANARLIAAAPDLLEVLKNIISCVGAGDADALTNAVNEAVEVVAKATGEDNE